MATFSKGSASLLGGTCTCRHAADGKIAFISSHYCGKGYTVCIFSWLSCVISDLSVFVIFWLTCVHASEDTVTSLDDVITSRDLKRLQAMLTAAEPYSSLETAYQIATTISALGVEKQLPSVSNVHS